MLEKNFYDNIEQPKYLKNILYSDTDSIYIVIPHKNAKSLSIDEKLKIVDETAAKINNSIINYLNDYFLPKSNISPDNNHTFFKTELLMSDILFTDAKKNYAYKVLAKENKTFQKPKISYTGIQVVRSDAAKMTQNILKSIIENVLLNSDIENKNKIKYLIDIINDYYNKFNDMCDNLNLLDISIPAKWGGREYFVNGMKLYNYIIEKEIFTENSSGKFIYCQFQKPNLFTNIDISRTKGICVPLEYNIEKLRKKMDKYKIIIDKKLQWEKLYTTTCRRIVDLGKKI